MEQYKESRNETTHRQLILDNVQGPSAVEKGWSFQQVVLGHCAKATKPPNPYPASYTKVNSKRITDLNVNLRP